MPPTTAAEDDHSPPGLRSRVAWIVAAGLLFELLYTTCALQAARHGVVATLATPWDAHVPFVPWMLVPYMSSVPVLVAAFLVVPTRAALRALGQRLVLATVVATLAFAAWPHRVAWTRPAVDGPAWLAALAQGLGQVDGPYNQWPSLHVAYAVLVAPAFLQALDAWRSRAMARIARVAVLAWLALMVAATVLTWQHHLADVAGGLALAALAAAIAPRRSARGHVALAYAALATGSLVLAIAWAPAWPAVALAAWAAACCASVARAYARDDERFLGKRDGGFPPASWLLHGPYLMGYMATWRLVRWRERRRPAITPVADGLWVGRRLAAEDLACLPPEAVVIDLAAELPQLDALRQREGEAFSQLDLVTPRADQRHAVVEAIERWHARGRPVVVHCAMGYRRSREAVADWLASRSITRP